MTSQARQSSTRLLTTTLLATALVVYSAQGLLIPVLAPVTRTVGLAEIDLGAVITLSASMLVLTGAWWGREVDRIGIHAVLVRGLVLATLGTAGFALMTYIAAQNDQPRWFVLSIFAITRGVLYGLGFAAVPVAGLAYLSSVTDGVAARTKAVGAFGAMQGIALVLGPAFGGLFAMGGILMPIYIAPALIGLTLAAVWALPSPAREERPTSERLAWGDSRVLPFLVAGGVLFLGLALVEIIMGFLVQDRLGLTNTETAGVVAIAGVLIGLSFAATQALVAPRLSGGPRVMIVAGSVISALGYACAAVAPNLATLLPSMVVIAIGLGLAVPGFNAGATLRVEPHEHAAVAGQLAATVGLTYVAGPILGAGLYAAHPLAPILAAGTLSLAAAVIAYTKISRTQTAPILD